MSKLIDTNYEDGLMLSGYQKKLNTMKKKFFVLYRDTAQEGARLEYFDSMRKFKSGTAPKRVVKLENCFNINRRLDTKHDYVIALATKDGGLGIVLETEAEMLKWLQALLSLQRSITNKADIFIPKFEHVWQVVVQKKCLAEERKIIGNYHVCLTPKSVTFIRIGSGNSSSGSIRSTDIHIPLNTIRRCGESHCLFYMEVGRQCIIGPGELWMDTEDPLVAQSMHKMISSAMSAKTDVIGDNIRKRSSSVTETSKPISFMDTTSLRAENKICNMNQTANNNLGRGRCDSFPTRTRESNDNVNQSFKSSHIQNVPCAVTHRPLALSRHSTSPPIPTSFGSTERKETVKSDDQEETGNYLPFRFKSAERAIPEENSEDLVNSDSINFQKDLYISMAPVVKQLDSVGNNKAQQDRQFDLGDGFSSCNNSQNSIITADLAPKMHGIIISSGKLSDFENEERPKRSYSIGSKIDKNKIKRLGNSNEILHDTNAVRVRAFSVGSRAKIPKCDLQRAVLFPRSRFNQSCISNNSLNFGTEDAGYKFELNTNCDKKSTSAPILAQNGHVSVDCMSDLMEIDFSKSSSHKTHGKVVPVSGKCSDASLNEIRGYFASKPDSELSQTLPLKPTNNEESGYLEMKPLNHETCSTNKPSLPQSNECVADMTKSSDNTSISCLKRSEAPISSRGKFQFEGKHRINHKNHLSIPNKDRELVLHEENHVYRKDHLEDIGFDSTSKSENMSNLACIYSQLSVQPISKKINDTDAESSNSMADNEKNKTRKIICHDEYSAKCILLDSIHGKSDSSKASSSDRERKLPLPGVNERYSVSINVPSLPSTSLSNACKLPSVSRSIDAPTLLTITDSRDSENLVGNYINENKTPQITTPTSSTACSSYELYYAKLDLPQCSTKDNAKFQKTENVSSPTINAENDSYAKIDFDHSSDSSSSSKTLNN
ncbi:insulin receptor substrate 1 isoform X2 [Zeugodacus cucurbitae]|nr:insulin receptor substrate 1 isoform X2 [Zeugodacus cucurbitae]XP_054083948.1 insulin receptor substrate 1 isoform X2 [Zeugodacus cucurbitae]